MGAPIDQVVLMAATSGTTGDPTPYPHTPRDIEINSELFARIAWRAGIRPGHRVVHAFGLSMWLAGVPYVQFLQRTGACILPVGAEGGSERILRFAQQFRADTLFGTPSLVEHLIERAPEVLGAPVASLGIKSILCAGEPGAGIPEVRQKIEEAYGAKLFDHGGGYGISCHCGQYQGMHHVADDHLIYEIVDPSTLQPLPLQHGAQGLAVQTTLSHEGMLWVRESFGDIVQVLTEPCECGQTGFRYKVIGRADDMLKVKGVMVYPAAIDGVIAGFAPRLTGEFRIVLTEPPPRVVPPLKLRVEYAAGVSESELPALAREIEECMHTRLKISPQILWAAPMSLPRTGGKTKFFEKAYEAQA
jgi:phenylacetate-CoA ligase